MLLAFAVSGACVSCSFISTAQKPSNETIQEQTANNKKLNAWGNQKEMDAFINDLMSKMTLEEKIGQTVLVASYWNVTGPVSEYDYVDDAKEGKIGAFLNARTSDFIYRIQKAVVENSRLGIPMMFGFDAIHGYSTTFPTPLAMSTSWDMEAFKTMAKITAKEAAADGLSWTYAPMVDIARDPRWGRIAEGAGEDPYLGIQVAKAQVEGFQGDDLSDPFTVAACVKHFAAYGAAQAGRDYNTTDVPERALRDMYLPPFKAAVDAGVATLMTAFNEIDGVPATGDKRLLTDILKNEWAFDGFVVTDYTSIYEMTHHGNVADKKEAGEVAMNAGVDMDMQSDIYKNYLLESVKEGKVNESLVDEACRRILEMKYRLGLFEDPYRYCDMERTKEVLKHPSHFEAARDIAQKSMVLLKNENDILPLSKNTKSVALIGPLADNQYDQLGAWHTAGTPETVTTILKGIEQNQPNVKVNFSQGCDFEKMDKSGFKEAIEAAKKSDVVLLAMGERQDMSGEAASRVSIELPAIQKELIKEVMKLNKPTVLLLHNGRPLAIEWEAENIPAILEVWHLGSEAGNAIADVVFGDYNPSGKLTTTFPRSLGQVPIFYNTKNTGRPFNPEDHFTTRYQDSSNDPLFPFGFGLSYTTFEYSDLKIDKTEIGADDVLNISVNVSNTGKMDGEEVVQLYVRDLVGSVTRPIKELKGFEKIAIESGKTKTVNFQIKPSDLAFTRLDYSWGYEAGDFQLFVGTNSQEVLETSFKLTDSNEVPYNF
ncbi:beta-glucosidase BglX [Aureibacter tunicatorum]|uniref:beta-glucosidase n=1 Tax=Aureibacter tunicatorum TaxID=866807 RepID=A0AAE3XSW7_9BACT|nr:beta-glucosidase BglX [Aureibacter tunicatorum]MDR6241424.1 beta-glucosidase [Aureibacter tunicatorum]